MSMPGLKVTVPESSNIHPVLPQVRLCPGWPSVQEMLGLQQVAPAMVPALSGSRIIHYIFYFCFTGLFIYTKLLFQNLLFYYDTEQSAKPTGVIFLEVNQIFYDALRVH